MLSLHTRPQHQLTQNLPRACSLVSYIPLARSTPSIRAARRAPRHPHAPGSAQRAAPPPLPPERELPAPKTPPDPLRMTCVKARPSAWPPRARRPARPPVRLTQAFRDCPGQVLSRRMPGVVGPSPLTHNGPRSCPSKTRPSREQLFASPASSAKRPSGVFAGSAIPGGKPVRGNSPPWVAARVPRSRPPIAAEVGGLEPSAPESLLPGKP